ncbi:MAG: Rieske (2Fe-2S) protein [Tetrasphaera sp.]
MTAALWRSIANARTWAAPCPGSRRTGQFVCPCHASAFERDGELINAPAPRPLDRFAVTIVDGVVLVDTGNAIQRDHTSTDDLVYA